MSRLKNSYDTCMECGGKMKMKSGGKWIQKAIKHPGSFTKQAQAAGMSVSAFRNKVLANKSAYSPTTVRRANLAKTLSKMRKGEEGMEVGPKSKFDYETMAPSAPYTENSGFDLAVSDFKKMPVDTSWPADNSPAPKYVEPAEEKSEPLTKTISTVKNTSGPGGKTQLVKNGNEAVAKYQRMLNEKYGLNLKVDGAWGPKTQAAYEQYVLRKGINSTNNSGFDKAASDFAKRK